MFTATSEELYTQYKKRFKNIPKSKLDLTFKVTKPDAAKDGEAIYSFYKQNAPNMMRLKKRTEKDTKELISRRIPHLVSAYLNEELVGHIMLVRNNEYGFYHITYPCTRKDLRRKNITVYMALCSMKYAEDVLKLNEVRVLVHLGPPFVGYESTLKTVIEKAEAEKGKTPIEKYNHERDKHLYRVFEEILGFRLMRFNQFICYIIRLWS